MKKLLLVFTIVLLALASTFALAADWNGYTVDDNDVKVSSILERGSGYGRIYQYTDHTYATNVAYTGNVLFTLPQIKVLEKIGTGTYGSAVEVYGVCIDTRQTTLVDPMNLKKGWADTHPSLDTIGRINGTVADRYSWERTTYLFNKYQSDLQTWYNDNAAYGKNAAAFQLAIWEVMSGDGSKTAGANFSGGLFRSNVTDTGVIGFANDYVKEAWADEYLTWGGGSSALSLNDHQDFLISAPTPPPGQGDPLVPEFPAAALAPLGLAAFGFIRRKFAK